MGDLNTTSNEEKVERLESAFNYLRSNGIAFTQQDIANGMNVDKGNISRVFNGDTRYLTNKFLTRFNNTYNNIFNNDWLLYGEGEMLKSKNLPEKDEKPKGKDIPLLPINAIGGTLDGFNGGVMPYECEWINVPLKAADMAITVAGDSMFPEYPSGCVVIIKKINEKSFIEWGNVYVLDTVNGTVIKRVQPCEEDESYVVCESVNEYYKPFKVPVSDVRGFYKVLMCWIRK